MLTEAQNACDAAAKSSIRFTGDADVSKAESAYNQSATQKRKITSDSKLLGTVKQYSSWTSSQQFSKLMNSTERCQTATAANIKKQKAAYGQQQDKAKQETARQTQLEKERQQLAEEQAKQEAEKRKQAEIARKQAAEEARKAASLEDVPDDAEVDDDEFGSFGDNDSSGGWTDLVK